MEHLDPEVLSFLKFIGGSLALVAMLCIGAILAVVTGCICAKITGASGYVAPPSCPWCDTTLRCIKVQSVDTPFPSEARWICANTYCRERGHLFSSKEGEPEPLPAKPEPVSEI